MYVAKLAGHLITEGIEIEIPGHPVMNPKFRVVNVGPTYFDIVWLTGDNVGETSIMPYSIFEQIDLPVEVIEIKEDSKDPNQAFLIKRLMETHDDT